jgi:Flp pilus assembly protein TadD
MGLLAERRTEEAAAEFQTALTLSPGFREAITQLVLLDIAVRKPEAALDRLRQQMVIVKGSADLYDLLGIVHVFRNQLDSAEASFIKSIELDSRLLDPRVRLAELYTSMGKFEQALSQAEAARTIEPNNLRALMAVGVAAQQKGDAARARQAYEAALAVNARFSAAANNLAILLLDRGETGGALTYALRAQESAPDDPHIADTLGWILYKRGEFDRATKILTESAAKLPQSPSAQYHLGVAAQKTGDTALARQALGRAVNSTTPFAERESARRALVGLK